MAAKQVADAFRPSNGHSGIFLVGSALERQDWRDVDVRMILDDDAFAALFPRAHLTNATWEFDARWTLMVTAITQWLRQQTGLPIDFQFQPMSWANERHAKPRHPLGLTYVDWDRDAEEE
jgi:hypothetical protein